MPNWCSNYLTGPADILKEFISVRENGEEYFDFNKIVPMPAHQPDLNKPNPFWTGDLGSEQKKLYGQNNWYDWAFKNWGTKWNACYSDVDSVESGFVSFETAWSPPIGIINALSELYPEETFALEYDEPGMGFCGIYHIVKGNVFDQDNSWGYHLDYNDGECPDCGGYLFTRHVEDDVCTKACEDCDHEFHIDRAGNRIDMA